MAKEIWNIDGLEVNVEQKPRQKNLYIKLRLHTAEIDVSAPKSMPQKKIEAVIRAHVEELKARQKEALEKLDAAPELITGDTVPLFGDDIRLTIEQSNTNRLSYEFDGDSLTLNVDEGDFEEKKRILRAWYKKELEARLPEVTRYCEDLAGIQASSYHVRHMKTRWGSCTHETARIRLATKLAMYPMECLVYVMVHELIHIEVPNHGPQFYKKLEKLIPNWKASRKLLESGNPYLLD